MISRMGFYVVLCGVLVSIASCVFKANKSDLPTPPATPSQSVTPSPTQSPSNVGRAGTPAAGTVQPDTKIITMNLEGKPTEVELKRFHQSPLAFSTYYPEAAFKPEMNSSEEGTGVRFYFSPTGKKDEAAYIHFFFPRHSDSLEAMQEMILGDRGLLVTNGWELIDRTDIVSYPWAKEKLLYQQQQGSEVIVGAIYIGWLDGQTFYVLTHYPMEYGDGFEPRSNLVLENLHFEEEPSP